MTTHSVSASPATSSEPAGAGLATAQPAASSAGSTSASPAPIKVIVTDLDGTLVRGRTVQPEDAQALRDWQAAGNLVVLATGRSVVLTRMAVEDISASVGASFRPDYVICASGAALLDAEGQVLRADVVPGAEVERAARALHGRSDVAVVASTLGGDFLLHNPFDESNTYFTPYVSRLTPGTIEQMRDEQVTSMPIHSPSEETCDDIAAQLVEAGQGLIDAPRSIQFLDVVARGINKGSAITHLRGVLADRGIEVGALIGVGDSWNDIPMFEVADRAYAMKDGAEDARTAALAQQREGEPVGALTSGLAQVVAENL